MKKCSLLIAVLSVSILQLAAQHDSEPRKKKWYVTRNGDAALVSFSNVSRKSNMLNNVPRFTAFLNSGTNFNTDFGNHAGFFTGINGKNIGVIYDDTANIRWKRRVLTLGVPAGFKFGNLKKGNFFYIGAQADFAFNYKEKKFVNGEKVSKSNDWFGKQTPIFMPSVFAGFRTSKKVAFKAQYFPNNFFNQNFVQDNTRPFAGMETMMFFITLSYDFSMREFVSGSTER
jgi:hypothetical protein